MVPNLKNEKQNIVPNINLTIILPASHQKNYNHQPVYPE